jgi:type IV secretory pathway VirB4 component
VSLFFIQTIKRILMVSDLNLSQEEISAVQAIVRTFYNERIANRFHAGSITSETLELVAQLITETDECSKWIDVVPNPKDLLAPTSSMRKWAIRVIRAAGEPFIRDSVKISLTCKLTRGLQFRSLLEASLR